jgi:hypothetical protein
MLACWLLNVAELGIGLLILFITDRQMPAVYVLMVAIGLVQVGYVVPLWRFFRRQGKPRAGLGVLAGAIVTAVLNLIFDFKAYGPGMFHFWR